MLLQFNFKNFRSFRDETSLDMEATRESEYPEHIVKNGGEKLLPVMAIFGANASGKSNVCKAFTFMRRYVIRSFSFGGDSGKPDETGELSRMPAEPYLFDHFSCNEPSSFEVFFTLPGDSTQRVYQYGFAIRKAEVVEEWLFTKAKTSRNYRTVFYREKGEDLDLSGIPQKMSELLRMTLQKETLIVSLGAKLNIATLAAVRDWFVSSRTIDFGDPDQSYLLSHTLPENFNEDERVQDDVVRFLSTFDDSIRKFHVEKTEGTADGDFPRIRVEALHRMNDGEGYYPLPFAEESSGTKKLFSLYPFLRDVLSNGLVLFIDELSGRLHPLMVRNIVNSFLDPQINVNHAQLILTTHDSTLFSSALLRRDEIWITEKNHDGISELYSLSEFRRNDGNKARKGEALMKRYLNGEFGGIPSLKPLTMMMKEEPNE